MDALLTAIQAKFTATPTPAINTAVSGKMYADEAPQNTVLPYILHSIPSGTTEFTFTETDERVRFQFDLYHQTQAGVLDLYGKLTALYDDCDLSVTGYVFQKMERIFYQKIKDEFYWRVIVQYAVWLEKA